MPEDASRLTVPGKPPLVSIVMPVRDGIGFVDAAVASIRHQSLADLELIVVDDGSSDGTPERIRDHLATDPRIGLVVRMPGGVAAALNHGCSLARGRYIARMDADDIARPDRFARQVGFLEAHPDIAVLGSAVTIIDAAGAKIGTRRFPNRHDAIARALRSGTNPVAHPSVMMRRAAFDASGGYDARFEGCEDYELWLRMLPRVRFANLNAPLVAYRVHAKAASQTGRLRQILVGRVACAMHRPGGTTQGMSDAIRWADLDRFDLDAGERARLAVALASVAMWQADTHSDATLAEAARALSLATASPRALVEAALERAIAARLRDGRAAELMASLARVLTFELRPARAARWLTRAAATHPGGPLGLAALAAKRIGRRLRRSRRRVPAGPVQR